MEWIVVAGVVGVVIGIGWMNYRSEKELAASGRLVMIQRLRDTRDVDAEEQTGLAAHVAG